MSYCACQFNRMSDLQTSLHSLKVRCLVGECVNIWLKVDRLHQYALCGATRMDSLSFLDASLELYVCVFDRYSDPSLCVRASFRISDRAHINIVVSGFV